LEEGARAVAEYVGVAPEAEPEPEDEALTKAAMQMGGPGNVYGAGGVSKT
jgi:hypothetical protein